MFSQLSLDNQASRQVFSVSPSEIKYQELAVARNKSHEHRNNVTELHNTVQYPTQSEAIRHSEYNFFDSL